MTTPFDQDPEEVHEIICPECGETGWLVSVERVYQTYAVYYTKEGELDFDGHVQKEWPDDEHGIDCRNCDAHFSRTTIRETEQAKQLQANAEKEEEQ